MKNNGVISRIINNNMYHSLINEYSPWAIWEKLNRCDFRLVMPDNDPINVQKKIGYAIMNSSIMRSLSNEKVG